MDASPRYRCHLLQGLPWVNDNPAVPAHSGLQAFTSGFWVDENYKLCLSGEKYWIPPSVIYRVEKLS